MIVYADILVSVNILVDFFLLLACAKILSRNVKTLKIFISALVGGISSLYIFLPSLGLAVDFIFKVSVLGLMCFIAFGFKNIRYFLKNTLVAVAVSCGYTGLMIAIRYFFKPAGMAVNNSVVYFNISPVALVVFTVIGYFIFTLFNFIFSKTAAVAEKCKVELSVDGNQIEIPGIIDTGNSIKDLFSAGEIIVVDKRCAELLFKDLSSKNKYNNRYRAIPCGTVSGKALLDGYRCDSGAVILKEKSIKLDKPVLAISKTGMPDEYSAIINPDILY